MYVCRLINYMDQRGYTHCTPRHDGSAVETQPLLGLKSGYVQRGVDQFPKQGLHAPWVLRQNYLSDLLSLHYGRVDDGALVFALENSRAAAGQAAPLGAEEDKTREVAST
jgi:hypothetical protein